MSRIYLRKTKQNSEPYGWSVPVPDDVEPDLGRDADFDILDFAARLLDAVDTLGENEALAIWKEIN